MKKYILYIIAILAGVLVSTPVFAETMKSEVNIKPSMTLDVPVSSINLNLDPATNAFASKDINITVGTNNKTGYWISMSSSTGESDLVNIDDNTKIIPTIATAGSYTSSNFPINQWGYKIDSGNYTPFVSGATIKSSNTIANGETFKLNIASKIDYLQPSGTYNMALNIKMLPNMIQEYMQDITPEMCTEEPSVVMDKRDGQTYTIARLKDGKCWMTQNLKLGKYTDSLVLTNADSNVSSDFILDNKRDISSSVVMPSGNVVVDGETVTQQYNGSAYLCTEEYGCSYNWYTATAGTGTTYKTSGNAEESICPSNWTLPTGGSESDYSIFSLAYNNSVSDILVNPSNLTENINGKSIPGLLLNGNWYDYGSYNVGKGARYWSKTANSNNKQLACGYSITLPSSVFSNDCTYVKYAGRAVRCLLKES